MACENTGILEVSSTQSFTCQIEDGCIRKYVSVVVGCDEKDFVYDARDEGICLDLIRQFK